MNLKELKAAVCRANQDLDRLGLVSFTFGNVSGIDRSAGLVVIKPSGVPYSTLKPGDMVVLDMDGRRIQGSLNPSSDAPTHLELYRTFPAIGGVTHTHSNHAVMFAQACRSIPCLGTTHADYFHGEVPVTRALTAAETESDYERNTGLVIAEHFRSLDPTAMPAVLVAHHGPFTWGSDAADAVHNAAVLEAVARMAAGTLALAPGASNIPAWLLDKHYSRKHGPGAYYGQKS